MRHLAARLALIGLSTLGLGLGIAGPGKADGPVILELFTSQGCSSCPPADRLLGELADRPDVIALALHVDYWDYIGWADTFADPAFTARQHAYAHAAGRTVVYTPQMVIGGADHVVGYRPMDVANLIARHNATPYPVSLVVSQAEGAYDVEAAPLAEPRPMVVQVVSYTPRASVDISRGENAGEVIDYHNIVTSLQVIEEWDGRDSFAARLRPEGEGYFVVIVQAAGHGRVLGAVRLN